MELAIAIYFIAGFFFARLYWKKENGYYRNFGILIMWFLLWPLIGILEL